MTSCWILTLVVLSLICKRNASEEVHMKPLSNLEGQSDSYYQGQKDSLTPQDQEASPSKHETFLGSGGGGKSSPRGHLKPFGSHPSLHTITEMREFPSPRYFYKWFVQPGTPVLFKSVLNTMQYPAYRKWTDEYLRDKFGSEEITTEVGKKETRRENGSITWTLSTFLDRYQEEDLYTVADLTQHMLEDVPLLPCLYCGGFQDALAVLIMWFSSGGTKSVLHFDSLDNINCLLEGSKDFIFIDKIHKSRIVADDYVAHRGYSRVDVDKVDLLKFPQLENIPWINAHMVKGDCIYIPKEWYHQVNSYGNRNLAVNVWMYHLPQFNQSDCENTNQSYRAMSEYSNAESEHIDRLDIQHKFEGLDVVFKQHLYKRLDSPTTDEVDTLFALLDADSNGEVTWAELNTFNVQQVFGSYKHLFLPPEQREAAQHQKESGTGGTISQEHVPSDDTTSQEHEPSDDTTTQEHVPSHQHQKESGTDGTISQEHEQSDQDNKPDEEHHRDRVSVTLEDSRSELEALRSKENSEHPYWKEREEL